MVIGIILCYFIARFGNFGIFGSESAPRQTKVGSIHSFLIVVAFAQTAAVGDMVGALFFCAATFVRLLI